MSISLASIKRLRLLFLCSCMLSITSIAIAAVPQASLKMPRVANSLLLSIEYAGERIVVVGERGHIIYSDDNAASWTQADVPVSQMITGLSFVDDKEGWAVGHDGHVLHTTDGGITWILQRNGLGAQAELNVRKIKSSKVKVSQLTSQLAALPPGDAGLGDLEVALEDAQWELESSQEKSQNPPIANPLLDVWFMDAKRGWAVGAFGQFIYTKNGGISWYEATDSLDNEMGYHLNAVAGGSNGSVYIGGEAGFLIYSSDAGKSWMPAQTHSESTIFDLTASKDGQSVYSTGLRAQTYRSVDSGANWVALAPKVNFSLGGVSLSENGRVLLVGAGGSIAYSINQGDSFAYATLPSRSSLSGVLALKNGQYVISGEGGVYPFDPKSTAK